MTTPSEETVQTTNGVSGPAVPIGEAETIPAPEDPKAAEEARAKVEADARRAKLKEATQNQKKIWSQKQKDQDRIRAIEAERDAERRARAEYEQRLGLVEKDPLGYLRSRGVSAKVLAERVLSEGTPEAAVKELAARVEAQEQAYQARLRELQQRQELLVTERKYEESKAELLEHFRENAEEAYPHLARAVAGDEDELLDEYLTLWERISKDPEYAQHTWSDEEVLNALEQKYARVYAREKASPGHKTGQSGKPSSAKPSAPAKPGSKRQTESKPFEFPANFDRLPDEEQNRLIKVALAAGWRG